MGRSRGSGTSQGAGMLSQPVAWEAPLSAGVITIVLGLIISVLPTPSLTVIAVMLGILMIISGIYHLLTVFGSGEGERLWRGLAGVLFVIAGVVLIRNLQLSLAVIGLLIGLSWIAQGVALLLVGSSGHPRGGAGWVAAFGVLSLIAGIVVVVAPVTSVKVLAVLMGIWFIVMGLMETLVALVLRGTIRRESASVGVPGQRAGGAAQGASRAASRQDVGHR
jgi:uncharacterized membrane protein HdeD (DUF308 family)